MGDLSFRQQAAQKAAVSLRARVAESDARQPFSVAIGTVTIAMRVCVGRPCYVGPDGIEKRADGDHMVVVLAMSNADGATPMQYKGWSEACETGFSPSEAALSDDAGTRYPRATTSRGLEKWVGQISGSRSVGPGETLTDLLVFATPQVKARMFILELPRTNWGKNGLLRVELPIARITNFPVAAL
jgi:hypothetical protein